MKTIYKGYIGEETKILSRTLGLYETDTFDSLLEEKVKEYQKAHGLLDDGIVGPLTWFPIMMDNRLQEHYRPYVSDYDWSMVADLLSVSKAALKAVTEVETGGKGGFLSPGKPRILFEAHVFYKRLVNHGVDPEKYMSAHKNIISKDWNRSLYKGGEAEWGRLGEAIGINEEAALESASWGIFQIMGFNYSSCGCSSIFEFTNRMKTDEFQQFILGLEFMRRKNLIPFLQRRDWAGFAYRYNGAGYKKNNYDVKLEKAFNKYSGK